MWSYRIRARRNYRIKSGFYCVIWRLNMAKIDVINNKMAMFMLCEAIGEERDVIDF